MMILVAVGRFFVQLDAKGSFMPLLLRGSQANGVDHGGFLEDGDVVHS